MSSQLTSQILWDAIKDQYGVVSMPRIYKDFKEAISIRFNPNQHPTPQFEKMAAAFARLGAVTVGTGANQTTLAITPQLQALIALSALPAKWENLIPIICAGVAIADLKLDDVASQVIGQFETETNRGQHKAAQAAQSVQKISTIKRKRSDPRFTKQGNQQQRQQQSSTPGPSNLQQPHRQRGGRGSGKGKGKGKQRDGAPQHSHFASVAALAPPTTHKVLHIGSSGSSVRTESEASPIEKSSSFYPSIKKARTLTEQMDVPATIQTVKTLEERFADINAQMCPCIDAFMDEEYDSDFDVDMSQPAKGALPIIDFEALDSESINALGLQFGELTTDGGSDKENRAPTPSYVAPEDIPEAREIMAMWENPPYSKRLERKTSNEVIDDIYNSYQEYLADKEFGTLISPAGSRAATPEVEYLSGPQDDDEPPYDVLDWGSDDEEYVSSLSNAPYTKNYTVSLPSLKGFEVGACKTVVQPSVNYKADLYYVNMTSFDLLKCEHNKYFSQCAKCKECTKNMWLLDSGASAHFTNNISDIIDYTPIAKSDRMPVKTAAHIIYVEGTGSVLLKHYIANKLVTTRVHPVFYIPSMSMRLLSMGVFLQQGLRILGNSQHINLLNNKNTIVQCKPLLPGQSLYWLDASSVDLLESNDANASLIYNVDYDLMHRRLSHPSKEVLRRAKDHTKGFPKGITIPTTTGLCPGCAQGKMPAASHPPSDTRAKAQFERIHSDLKSFPVPSYHKYKYFIIFLNDYTSFAWITLLWDKASAITALKQWLALIKNQFNATIKEWMSDAGREYKSGAFTKHLKDAGITVLQSAPHMPQQNGHTECFMCTIMDKAQAMHLDTCLPQSWWEFAVNHAAHCYNRTPMSRLKWQTPYYLLNNEIPDISHLRVFGCGAYVHIPEARWVNKLSPKSELMVYLGRGPGMKANIFMRTPNTLFYSDKALFDETLFPRCPPGQSKGKPSGVTQLDKPASKKLPLEDDTTPGDDDYTPPEPPIGGSAPQPAGAGPPSLTGGSGPPQAPPSPPDPVPGPSQPRRSSRVRKLITCPENVYGERPPTTIICDIAQTCTW